MSERIPFPTDQELNQLDDMGHTILSMMQDKLEFDDYQMFARHLVDSMNGNNVVELQQNPDGQQVGAPRIRYGDPDRLLHQNYIWNNIGEYNPDRIPIRTYEKMALHPQMALGTSIIVLQILAQNYRIVCDDEVVQAFVNDSISPVYRKTNRSMLKAVQFGFAVGEKQWKRMLKKIRIRTESGTQKTVYNGLAIVLDNIKFAHPSSIRIERYKRSEDIRYVIQELVNSDLSTRTKIKRSKILWFALDAEYGNVFGNARYKNSYQAWYYHQVVTQYMLKYLSRRGSPTTVVEYPPGKSKIDGEAVDNSTLALRAGIAATSNSVVAFPREFDKQNNSKWFYNQLEDSQRSEMFLDVLSYLNTQMLRGLFVPDQTATSEGGTTNATAETHLDVHMMNQEALIQDLEDAWNTQVIPDLINYNFPAGRRPRCRIKIERLNFNKRTMMGEVFKRMIILAGSMIREGIKPNFLPSLKQMGDHMEIPMAPYDEMFLSAFEDDGSNGNNSTSRRDRITPGEKEQRISDRNRENEPMRSPRTTKERKDRENRY